MRMQLVLHLSAACVLDPKPPVFPQVVRLVVAGGGIGQLDALAAAGTAAAAAAATGGGASSTAASRSAAASAALQPVRELDLLLAELCAALPVDVMPGAEDPANVALPQQPMHRWGGQGAAGVGDGGAREGRGCSVCGWTISNVDMFLLRGLATVAFRLHTATRLYLSAMDFSVRSGVPLYVAYCLPSFAMLFA